MTGPAGERLDLIAEVFDDEPPNESATRVTLGAPVAIGTPAGERLEPVEPGQMRDGDEVIGTPKVSPIRDVYRNVSHIKGLIYLEGLGDVDPDGYTWQRVVADRPLPEEPNRVAIVILSEDHATGKKTFVVSGADGGEILWCDGTGTRWRPPAITRVVYVYPAAPEGQPQ